MGNTFRRDDGVGPAVAELLREALAGDIEIVFQSGEGATLMESWRDALDVYLIDAVKSGAAPGTVFRLDASEPIPSQFFHYSTHDFSVAEAVEMARALKRLPPRMILYGIEGGDFSQGPGLSPQVAKAAEQVVKRIVMEIQAQDI